MLNSFNRYYNRLSLRQQFVMTIVVFFVIWFFAWFFIEILIEEKRSLLFQAGSALVLSIGSSIFFHWDHLHLMFKKK